MDQRKPITLNYVGTFGIRRTIGLYAIEFVCQYDYGLRNLVKEEGRYLDQNLVETYSYVPDDFKMDNLQFRIGVSRHFVKPVKRQQ